MSASRKKQVKVPPSPSPSVNGGGGSGNGNWHQRESSLFLELRNLLPLAPSAIQEHKGRQMGREAVLRLVLCFIRTRNIQEWLGVAPPSSDRGAQPQLLPSPSPGTPQRSPTTVAIRNHKRAMQLDEVVREALGGGFALVLSSEGTITYVSTSVNFSCLGFSNLEMMGKNIRECVHPSDSAHVERLLTPDPVNGSKTTDTTTATRSRVEMIRFKLSDLRPQPGYKMLQVSGKLFQNRMKGVGNFFVGLAEPLTTSPADDRFPLESFLSQSMFTTVHTLDLRFVSADAEFAKFIGYTPEDYMGRIGFELVHPEDVGADRIHIKNLYERGNVQTDQFRLLVKGGGYAVVYAAKTVLSSTSGKTVFISRHWVMGYENKGEIVSSVQLLNGFGVVPSIKPTTNAASVPVSTFLPSPAPTLASPSPASPALSAMSASPFRRQSYPAIDLLTPPPSIEEFLGTDDDSGAFDLDPSELDEFLEEHMADMAGITDTDMDPMAIEIDAQAFDTSYWPLTPPTDDALSTSPLHLQQQSSTDTTCAVNEGENVALTANEWTCRRESEWPTLAELLETNTFDGNANTVTNWWSNWQE